MQCSFQIMHLLHLYVFLELKHPFGIFRLKDCVDLLERMQQNGLLDMKEVNYVSNSLMVFALFLRGMGFTNDLCNRKSIYLS